MAGRGLFARLFATHLIVAVGALAVLGITADTLMARRATDALRDRLEAQAEQAQVAIDPGLAQPQVEVLADASRTRFTVIASDGRVIADSERDPATMENHAQRPEVAAALGGATGSDLRTSETVGTPYLYVAIPERNGFVVRAALPAAQVARERGQIRIAIFAAAAILTLVAAALSAIAARSVAGPLVRLTRSVKRVADGDFTTVEPGGPAEARELAQAVNAMAHELAQRVDAIRRSGELRDRILGSMDEAVVLGSGDDVVYANPAAERLLGAAAGQPVPPAVVPGSSESGVREVTLHHPTYRELTVTTSALEDGTTLIVAQDVTDSRRIDRVRRDFVANASHEMKTPVAGILATAETLQDAIRDDPEAAQRFAETLASEARRLSNLIQDLLDLARLDQPVEPDADPVDLSALVQEAFAEAGADAERASVRLHAQVEPDLRVRGRARDLSQLVRNLLENAIRYTQESGRVDVSLTLAGERARLDVRDTGIGIPQKDLPRVFERFYRVDRARARDTGGTGLGLAIVRHVAEAHGGAVSAISELGASSTFTVFLPLSRDES